MESSTTSDDETMEQYKIKKIYERLSSYRGNGTSLITIMIPTCGDLNGMKRTLTDEVGTATNIKSRVNRLSVLSALSSAQHKLKQYTSLPKNGLVIYCGEPTGTTATAENDDGKSKKINICIEPYRPLHHKMYMCDSQFHVEPLKELLQSDKAYGFVIVDGNGALFGILTGDHKTIKYYFSVDLPKKHKKGGQSAARFGRLAKEARHNYITKVGEFMLQYFIGADTNVNVAGIILAGSAEMKDKLNDDKNLDIRLKKAIVNVITISYGGQRGFDEAIQLSSSVLSGLKCIQEQKELQIFFEHVAKDTGMISYGIQQTMTALELGSIAKVIVSDKLQDRRFVIKDTKNNVEVITIKYAKETPDLPESSVIVEDQEILDWLVDNYKKYNVVIVSDTTSEGTQFYKGFGGLGGILRWKLDLQQNCGEENDDSDSDFI
jgi:peptide chain release factor subunit 1